MANSVTVTLSSTIWTDISSLAANGIITNESNYPIIVKEALNIPAANDVSGHTVFAGPDGFYNWAGVTQTIWARAVPAAPAPVDAEVTLA